MPYPQNKSQINNSNMKMIVVVEVTVKLCNMYFAGKDMILRFIDTEKKRRKTVECYTF